MVQFVDLDFKQQVLSLKMHCSLLRTAMGNHDKMAPGLEHPPHLLQVASHRVPVASTLLREYCIHAGFVKDQVKSCIGKGKAPAVHHQPLQLRPPDIPLRHLGDD